MYRQTSISLGSPATRRIARNSLSPDRATVFWTAEAAGKMSTDFRVGRDIMAISVMVDDLQRMVSLAVDVESITPLRSGDQLDEIGTPMPNGFIGQG